VAVKVSASILDCDFTRLKEELLAVVNAGIDAIHLDIMDGHFVPNLSFGVPIARAVRQLTKLPVYSHLMVLNPEKMIERFSPYSDFILFHIEATTHTDDCITAIYQSGCQPGLALNPDTPIDTIIPYLPRIMNVLVMSVFPGFGGQKFIPESLSRIHRLHQLRAEKDFKYTISVDGGVSPLNCSAIVNAGADILVAGSAIFKSNDYAQTICQLRCLNH